MGLGEIIDRHGQSGLQKPSSFLEKHSISLAFTLSPRNRVCLQITRKLPVTGLETVVGRVGGIGDTHFRNENPVQKTYFTIHCPTGLASRIPITRRLVLGSRL